MQRSTTALLALTLTLSACTATSDDDEGFGSAAGAEEADRRVEVELLDNLAYDPAILRVGAGEVVTFVVTNTGAAVHEFVIGDPATQEEHEAEMADGGQEMTMQDEDNAVSVEPGETTELTWRFPAGGDILYGCHQPGHYAGGMVGRFEVGG